MLCFIITSQSRLPNYCI